MKNEFIFLIFCILYGCISALLDQSFRNQRYLPVTHFPNLITIDIESKIRNSVHNCSDTYRYHIDVLHLTISFLYSTFNISQLNILTPSCLKINLSQISSNNIYQNITIIKYGTRKYIYAMLLIILQ